MRVGTLPYTGASIDIKMAVECSTSLKEFTAMLE